MEDSAGLDLRRHEDLFTCVDILTRSGAVLAGFDPHLAQELSAVLNGLVALSQTGNQTQDSMVTATVETVEPCSLLAPTESPANTPLPSEESENGIVDVLTGEVIGN